MLNHLFRKSVLVATICGASLGAAAQDASVPKHLQLARDFVANTKQENNSYSNRNIYTRMPGDLFASDYVVATDCGGFVEDMFRRARSGVLEQLKTKKFKNRFSIFDWHPQYREGRGVYPHQESAGHPARRRGGVALHEHGNAHPARTYAVH